MVAIEPDYAIAFSEKRYAVEVVHSSRICCTSWVDSREKVYCHHAASIVVVIVAERVGQHTVLFVINVTQSVIWFHDFNHPNLDFLLQILVKIEAVNLNNLSIVM